MARLAPRTIAHVIVVVEDDQTLRQMTADLLRGEGHDVHVAATPSEAVEIIRLTKPHLVLLDYYLEGGTGEEVVRAVRAFDQLCEVLLVTGYASEQPARRLLRELDVQGYHDKADGAPRLLVLCDAALKHFRASERLRRQAEFLEGVLRAAPAVQRLQAPDDLLGVALDSLVGLVGGRRGLVATCEPRPCLVEGAPDRVHLNATVGDFAGCRSVADLPATVAFAVRTGLEATSPVRLPDGVLSVPICSRTGDRGCIVVQGAKLHEDLDTALGLFALHVNQSLENVLLYERATVDGLTSAYNRSFGLQRLAESLVVARRRAEPTSVLFLDLDHFKAVNDERGHEAGDLLLRAVARTVRETCRRSDELMRYGGEELVVVLPATSEAGARVLAESLRAAIAALRVSYEREPVGCTVSIGVATAEAGEVDGLELLRRADEAMYTAKRNGRDQFAVADRGECTTCVA